MLLPASSKMEHALRVIACARIFHSIVEGKEMGRISGVLCLLLLLDPLHTLLLWGVAAKFWVFLSLGDFMWEQATRPPALRSIKYISIQVSKVCWDPSWKIVPHLVLATGQHQSGGPKQTQIMCLSAQLFPHMSLIKKPQRDKCQKPLKHWLALALNDTHGRAGLQYE